MYLFTLFNNNYSFFRLQYNTSQHFKCRTRRKGEQTSHLRLSRNLTFTMEKSDFFFTTKLANKNSNNIKATSKNCFG